MVRYGSLWKLWRASLKLCRKWFWQIKEKDMGWELGDVEKPFVAQLLALGW